jgi:hypothetical protein
MHLLLIDGVERENLLPFTFTRPVSEIRVGILTITEKWERAFSSKAGYLTQDYLQSKYKSLDSVDRDVDVSIVLGIRPDLIRASILLELLRQHPEINMRFIWSGQHYSETLKDVFIDELNLPKPDITELFENE